MPTQPCNAKQHGKWMSSATMFAWGQIYFHKKYNISIQMGHLFLTPHKIKSWTWYFVISSLPLTVPFSLARIHEKFWVQSHKSTNNFHW